MPLLVTTELEGMPLSGHRNSSVRHVSGKQKKNSASFWHFSISDAVLVWLLTMMAAVILESGVIIKLS